MFGTVNTSKQWLIKYNSADEVFLQVFIEAITVDFMWIFDNSLLKENTTKSSK